MSIKEGQSKTVILRRVTQGSFICEAEFASSQNYKYTAISEKFTKIVYLTYDDYFRVIKESPDSREKFQMVRDNLRFNENFKFSGSTCEICFWTHDYLK